MNKPKSYDTRRIQVYSPWIFATNNCNLRCPYCWEDHVNKNMTPEVWQRINDTYGSYIQNRSDVAVRYRIAGGEPLLVWKDWKDYPVQMNEKFGGRFRAGIITNLTVYNDEIRDYLIANKIATSVSLDGTKNSKIDINGNSTASKVLDNIIDLRKHGQFVNILTVMNDTNLKTGELLELAEFVANWGIAWKIDYNHFGISYEDSELMYKTVSECVNILKRKNYNTSMLIFNLLHCNAATSHGCSGGTSSVSIDTNGDIYPCQTLCGTAKPLGNILDNIDLNKMLKEQKEYKLGYNYTYPEECRSCEAFYHCGGSCHLHHHPSEDNPACELIKKVYRLFIENEMFPM